MSSFNTAVGPWALERLIRGDYNVAIGARALRNLHTGSFNIALGAGALEDLREGSGWIQFGRWPAFHDPGLSEQLAPFLMSICDQALMDLRDLE